MNLKYMETDAPWLPAIPASWAVTKIKRIGRLEAGAGFPHSEQGRDDEELPFFKVGDMAKKGNERYLSTSSNTISRETARKLGAQVLPPGTIVFAKVGAALLLNRRRMLAGEGCVDNNVMAFIPAVDPDWAYYWLSSLDFARLANPGAVPSVNEGQIGELTVPLPPPEDQCAIASFLDRETARIDNLIEKKRRLLDLLEEKRTAIITQAVTRGLDPDVPMKESGVEWIGEIPEHWKVVKLSRLLKASLTYGVLKPERYTGEGAVPLLRIGDVERGVVDLGGAIRISPEQSREYARTVVHLDDVVVSVVGSLGSAFVVGPELAGANLSRALARVQLGNRMTSRFLEWFFSSGPFLRYVDLVSRGTAQKVLNLAELGAMRVPLPPLEEQDAGTSELTRTVEHLGDVRSRVRRAISLLQEYRTALISAAVNGHVENPAGNETSAVAAHI